MKIAYLAHFSHLSQVLVLWHDPVICSWRRLLIVPGLKCTSSVRDSLSFLACYRVYERQMTVTSFRRPLEISGWTFQLNDYRTGSVRHNFLSVRSHVYHVAPTVLFTEYHMTDFWIAVLTLLTCTYIVCLCVARFFTTTVQRCSLLTEE